MKRRRRRLARPAEGRASEIRQDRAILASLARMALEALGIPAPVRAPLPPSTAAPRRPRDLGDAEVVE